MLFQNPHYLTRGVDAEIPLELQVFMWECVNSLPADRDYLQVFKLEPMGEMQRISHTSEQPEHHMEYILPTEKPITAKLYVIDSIEYSTMLLAEEY